MSTVGTRGTWNVSGFSKTLAALEGPVQQQGSPEQAIPGPREFESSFEPAQPPAPVVLTPPPPMAPVNGLGAIPAGRMISVPLVNFTQQIHSAAIRRDGERVVLRFNPVSSLRDMVTGTQYADFGDVTVNPDGTFRAERRVHGGWASGGQWMDHVLSGKVEVRDGQLTLTTTLSNQLKKHDQGKEQWLHFYDSTNVGALPVTVREAPQVSRREVNNQDWAARGEKVSIVQIGQRVFVNDELELLADGSLRPLFGGPEPKDVKIERFPNGNVHVRYRMADGSGRNSRFYDFGVER
jgi:hypothetical protein